MAARASRALSDDSAAGTPASAAESLKYRLSCDRCQNTKVRCSRDKPSCRRCAQRGVSCVYSPLGRIGRPRKVIHEDTGLDDDEDEDDISESLIRPSSTLSPGNSTSHRASTTATSLEDVASTDIQMMDSNAPTPETNSRAATSSDHFVIPSYSNDEHLRSAVDSWISDHQLCVASPSQSQSQSQENHAGANLSTLLDRSNCANAQALSYSLDSEPGADCYVCILAQTTKLEQSLARTKLAPPIDLVLEAERDFCALRYRLITCTGHGHHRSPHPGNRNAGTDAELPQDHAGTHGQPCLTSDRPVLLGLALLAERIVGILEDMFRLAARSAHNMDKANDLLWYGAPGMPAGPSAARRLQRSFRSTLASPCVTPVVEANRDLRIGNLLVQGQAKSDALKRILRLRVDRMLGGLQTMKSALGVKQSERERGQLMDGPLDWGGSRTLLRNMAGTLLDDLVRRIESMKGAMVLL
ncbi:hypothetical protein F5X99DRAFT_385970 [Biscogniauxia marginata]|nr:hypothetical protein F5X99DRAFT_385970 [Biscogniauxia marginata]